MILVADSGSSKTDWILSLPDHQQLEFTSPGLNPYFLSDKDITRTLQYLPEIKKYGEHVKEIYFFGAGCSSPDKRETVSNGLSTVFKNAFISVDDDLTGSAYATCGSSKGLTCILGTGSNICYFDGKVITDGRHGLGFILGDEGSGTFFGKKLVTDYLFGTMPTDLQKAFHQEFKVDKEVVIQRVYKDPFPNQYLASFAKFMSEFPENAYLNDLLYSGFSEFVNTHIASYPMYAELNCHFVGSIAYHYRDALTRVCEEKGVHVGRIIKKPIQELYQFILKKI